jgi:CDP-diacylglycerol---serine O-phosphatidyltransferase
MASWRKSIPCGCTFLALCAGVGSLLAAGMGSFLLSAQLILVSLILDGLDGTLARLLRGQTVFGAELDTFVDMTSFGIAPAVLLYFIPMACSACRSGGWCWRFCT